MSYSATVKVTFSARPEKVYDALINLADYPQWNSGMVSISATEMMKPGMQFETTSMVMGRENKSQIRVVQLVKNRSIELVNDAGMVSFTARYELIQVKPDQTEVMCILQFEVNGMALKFAAPAIEAMAKARIKGDLETLRAQLNSD